MGCDIHLYVETKKDDHWRYYDWSKQFDEGGYQSKNYEKMFDHPLYVGRNYNLFAILADVRNGVGFAGVDTGDPFNVIARPRGLPDDVSKQVKKEHDGWGSDAHSASWLLVKDLKAFDWNQKTKHRGWVDPWNFELFRKNGKPGNWCGGVGGQGVEHVTNQQMARMIDSGEIVWEGPAPNEEEFFASRLYSTGLQRDMKKWPLPKGSVGDSMWDTGSPRHYTAVEWEKTYATSVKYFLEATLPALYKLGDPEEVRLVFWFDN